MWFPARNYGDKFFEGTTAATLRDELI